MSDEANGKLHEIVAIMDDRVEDLMHIYENTPRWRWIRRRDLLLMINAVGIVQYAISQSAHTYSLGG